MNVEILVRRCGKWLLIMAVSVIILFAILINVARFTIPVLNHKRHFFERWASNFLHQSVHIGGIKANWYGLDFVVSFRNVFIINSVHQKSLLHINQLSVRINPFLSLFHWQLLPSHLVLSGAQFDVSETENGRLHVCGITNFNHKYVLTNLGDEKNILFWMLKKSSITLKAISINYHTFHGNLIPISNFCVEISNGILHHQMTGFGNLSKEVLMPFQFLIITSFNNTSLYVEAKKVIFKQWLDSYFLQKYLKNLSVSSGEGDIQLWARFYKGILKSIQSLMIGNHIRLAFNQSHLLLLDHISANLFWRPYTDGWGLIGDHVFLQTGGKKWLENSFGIRVIYENLVPMILFKTNYLRLKDIYPLANRIRHWPEKFQKLYRKIQLSGEFHNFSLFYFPDKKRPYYHIKTDFTALSVQPRDHLSSGSQLFGSIDLTPSRGKLQLQSNTSVIKIPRVFKNPLTLKQLHLITQWYQSHKGWNINVLRSYVVSRNWQWWGKVNLFLPVNKSPYISLQGKFKVENVHSIKSYLPYRYMSSNLSDWLNKAFISGKITTGTVNLKGPLKKFPFSHKEGYFNVVADVNGVTLHYNSKWPNLQNIDGTIAFHNDGLDVFADRAEIMGNPLNHLRATIAHWAHPILVVSGNAVSNLADGFRFLQATPLLIAKKVKAIVPNGPLKINLNLKMPVNQRRVNAKVDGHLFVNNAQLFLKNWGIKLDKITGNFNFVNENFSADHIEAQFLNSPINFSIATTNQGTSPPVFQIRMNGQIPAKMLRKQFNFPILNYLSGFTSYRALLKLRSNKDSIANSFFLITNLIGIRSMLPPPYSKLAQDSALLNLISFFRNNKILVIKVHYKNHLITKADTWFGLSPRHEGWTVNINSPLIIGDLSIPSDQRQWKGYFLRFYLPNKKAKDKKMKWNPKELPPINLAINDFRYGKNLSGKLVLQTSRIRTGLNIDNFTAISPLFYIRATGKWQQKKDQTETRLVGQFVSHNLGGLLKKWRVTQVLEGGKGRTDFSLQWSGSPDQFVAAQLSGSIKINFYQGRITELTKGAESELGLGRLLNLFSLQSLPKLPVNLANFSKKGFAFNVFKGNFSLSKGIAKTKDASLVGDIAWVQIRGLIGFVNKDYDFHLEIIPNITSTLPLIVSLADGPLAGVITWVASQVLAPHVGKAAKVNYHILGFWNKPAVILPTFSGKIFKCTK
ncbi:MAG: YhdP family protein [Coxiella endosymbiont of Dermacentor silvarum]